MGGISIFTILRRINFRNAFEQKKWMEVTLIILVLADIEETRDGIEKLLTADGYNVKAARNEEYAVESAQRKRPDLILVGLGGVSSEVVMTALRIRERAELSEQVPVVIFCMEEVEDGGEVEIEQKVYLAHPDNFNQMRKLIARLLCNVYSYSLT
jgi:DNA-binding response OmpR family regulator